MSCVDPNQASRTPCAGDASGRGPCGSECAKCAAYVGNISKAANGSPVIPVIAGAIILKMLGGKW